MDRRLADAQDRLIEIVAVALVGMAELRNVGCPDDAIVQGLGAVLGSAAASVARSTAAPQVAMQRIMTSYCQAVNGIMTDRCPPDAVQASARFSAIIGGHA